MDLDALLARSQAPGQFVERQSFTLSRGKALSKMRDFTLRNPQQFGLELVQAGVFAGANWIFADCDPHQATIGWVGGRSLKRAELDGLLDYLFVGEGASPVRHLRQLAVTVNVLLRREPLVLRVESGDGDEAVRLDLQADGTGVVGTPAEMIMGTYLHVRFSKPWFWQTSKRSKVAAMIETECTYSPVPIFVNGDGPLGWDRHLPLSNPMSSREAVFRGHGRDGWIGRAPRRSTASDARVKVVVGGVVVSRREIPQLGDGIVGVIRDDQLAKTADMSDVVADDSWNRMLHHVQPLVSAALYGGQPLPALEPLSDDRDEDVPDDAPPEVAPLSAGLTLLGHQIRLPTDDLIAFAHEPLFWVAAADVRELEETLGDEGFPARVVILEDDQQQAFADLAGGHRPNRLLPDHGPFVREQLAKGRRVCHCTVATDRGLLTLTHHAAGPMPPWRLRPFGLSLLVRHPDGTEHVETLSLRLPRVTGVLELDAELDPEDGLRHVAHVVERHVWSLALEARDPGLTRDLLDAALHLQPTSDGPRWCLPTSWPPAAQELLTLPLVEGGPHADDLLGCLGTGRVLRVTEEEDVLAAFAARFGGGHVTGPTLPARPLLAVQWDGAVWQQVDHPEQGVARAVLIVMDQYGVQHPSAERSAHPAIVQWRTDPAAAVPFDAGYDLLRDLLRATTDSALPDGADDVVQAVRIALLGAEATLPSADGQATLTVEDLRAGRVRMALRGGLGAEGTGAVVVPWDWVPLIGGQPRWHLDDPPELWAPEPDPEEWLVSVDVLEDGLTGWLGLRFPYDATGGILLQQGLRTRIVGELEHGGRFHGRLDHTDDSDPLPIVRAHTLDVLQALLRASDLSDEREAVRQRYCADFASIARLHPECGIPTSLAEALARRVRILDWGTFHAWLAAPTDQRPPLPFQVRGLTADPLDPEAALVTESAGSPLLDAMRLTLRRAGVATRVQLAINPDGWHTVVWDSGAVTVSFGGRSRVVRLADEGFRRALGLTLLDAVRRLAAYEAEQGTQHLDLLALQRAALEVTAAST
jgi:hypothetical protein